MGFADLIRDPAPGDFGRRAPRARTARTKAPPAPSMGNRKGAGTAAARAQPITAVERLPKAFSEAAAYGAAALEFQPILLPTTKGIGRPSDSYAVLPRVRPRRGRGGPSAVELKGEDEDEDMEEFEEVEEEEEMAEATPLQPLNAQRVHVAPARAEPRAPAPPPPPPTPQHAPPPPPLLPLDFGEEFARIEAKLRRQGIAVPAWHAGESSVQRARKLQQLILESSLSHRKTMNRAGLELKRGQLEEARLILKEQHDSLLGHLQKKHARVAKLAHKVADKRLEAILSAPQASFDGWTGPPLQPHRRPESAGVGPSRPQGHQGPADLPPVLPPPDLAMQRSNVGDRPRSATGRFSKRAEEFKSMPLPARPASARPPGSEPARHEALARARGLTPDHPALTLPEPLWPFRPPLVLRLYNDDGTPTLAWYTAMRNHINTRAKYLNQPKLMRSIPDVRAAYPHGQRSYDEMMSKDNGRVATARDDTIEREARPRAEVKRVKPAGH